MIGIVAKDIGAARTLAPIAVKSRESAHVTVFLEGLALEAFPKIGTRVIVGGKEKPETEQREGDFWDSVLRECPVRVLVVGTSSPIHAERELALAANRVGTPVAAFPDVWGAETRLGDDVRVDLWFAIDEKHAEMLGSGKKVVVVGSPVYETLIERPTAEARRRLAEYGDPEKMLLVVGQGYQYLPDVMHAAIALLRGTPGLKLIPRLWHPKKGPDKKLSRLFDELIFRAQLETYDEVTREISTDTLSALCGTTVSVFSTPLLVAGANGNRAISIHSAATRTGMAASTGLDFYPPATADGPIYRWNVEPSSAMPERSLDTIPRGRYQPRPLDTAKAVSELLRL